MKTDIKFIEAFLILTTSIALAQTPLLKYQYSHGGIIRGNSQQRQLALIFTGGDFSDGGRPIRNTLKSKHIPASFFFTGDFYRNPKNKKLIKQLVRDGHYLGAHSDKHLLYCSWEKRDSLLVNKTEFIQDLEANYLEMAKFGIKKEQARFFMPPFEWYNDSIATWAKSWGLVLVNFTPGTLSNADYTIPSQQNYRSSERIWQSIIEYEQNHPDGLNGFLLLLHIGTHPERTDKFYYRFAELVDYLQQRGYRFLRIDELLKEAH